jgi:ornithine carbamoyltransferase
MTIHFISSDAVTPRQQSSILARAADLKRNRGKNSPTLEGANVAMIFEKPSTRTRISFEVAIVELGGHPLVLRGDELQLGRGETVEDTARVLSRYVDAIVIRTYAQDRLATLAMRATVPVVNALSDFEHPCQALADVFTIGEHVMDRADVRVAYLGDGNNVCHSLLIAGAKAGFSEIRVATPHGYEPDAAVLDRAGAIGRETGTAIRPMVDPSEACSGATVLYTDVWASMGREAETVPRRQALRGHALTADRLAEAAPGAIVMHCLPAHRGEEITDEVLDGPASVVWDQSENRLHVQKALLEFVMDRV